MPELKLILGTISFIVAVFCFLPYLRDIWRGSTAPHGYSWLVWALLQGTGALVMYRDGAGLGITPLAIGALLCGFIFLVSLKKGTKDITVFDTICLIGALTAICLWVFLEDPVLSVLLISAIDLIGFLPTFRKTYKNPKSETLSTYALSAVADLLGILAISHYSFLTTFYIGSRVATNSFYTIMMYARRRRFMNNA